MEISTVIKELRRFSGRSQTDVADQYNAHLYADRQIDKGIVSKMEKGSYGLKAQDIFIFCDIFQLSANTFRELVEESTEPHLALQSAEQDAGKVTYMVADAGYQGGIISAPLASKVVVNPAVTPKNGDLVAVRTDDMPEKSAAVRKYVHSLGHTTLVPQDKNYPSIPLTPQTAILGVVVDIRLANIL